MKYRAGIAPPRPRGPKRLSEYQMQYKWKDVPNNTPLLAAEQVPKMAAICGHLVAGNHCFSEGKFSLCVRAHTRIHTHTYTHTHSALSIPRG